MVVPSTTCDAKATSSRITSGSDARTATAAGPRRRPFHLEGVSQPHGETRLRRLALVDDQNASRHGISPAIHRHSAATT